jgi:hypothetical protein
MHPGRFRSFVGTVLPVAMIAGCAFAAGCSEGGSLSVDDLRNSKAPYYYVGRSFEGLKISHVEQYQRGVATFIYGTCKARSDEGCAPPLELQHWRCHGSVTVVIFANKGRAARAAGARRPLSRGAKARRPQFAFERSPGC